MKLARIAIVEDHLIFRNGLKLLLNKLGNVKLVAEASNGKEFLEILKKQEIDLVFLDINMPVLDGFETAKIISEKFPELKIIILTTFDDNDYFSRMIQLGVAGFMLKNSSVDDFINAIDKVISGGNYYAQDLLLKITQDLLLTNDKKDEAKEAVKFSKREFEVFELICKGYSTKKIGEKLFISKRTVERHKTNLLRKTDSQNTVNLVIYAFKNKFVE